MQTDGTLALFQIFSGGATQLWTNGIGGMNRGSFAVMQDDGNFVVYPGPGIPAPWSTRTWSFPGAYLAVQNDGNVVVYDAGNNWRWQSGTCCH